MSKLEKYGLTPVYQRYLGGIEGGPNGEPCGDCFCACVATLLGLPIEQVPHFVWETHREQGGDGKWFDAFGRWLASMRLHAIMLNNPRGSEVELCVTGEHGQPLAIVGGPSPRAPNRLHAVLYDGDGLVHDPHPAGGGVLDVADVIWIVSTVPRRPVGRPLLPRKQNGFRRSARQTLQAAREADPNVLCKMEGALSGEKPKPGTVFMHELVGEIGVAATRALRSCIDGTAHRFNLRNPPRS